MSDTSVPEARAPLRPLSSGFIVGPLYDALFFILSPLLALGLGIVVARTRLSSLQVFVPVFDIQGRLSDLFISTFIMAHLSIVFFRSHGNPKIFGLYPLRFTLVPIALFGAMCASLWASVAIAVLATWWDVYHSSLQTFGLGRIYDARAGNDALVGRRLDFLLNLLLYAGPILAGVSLMGHTADFHKFDEVGSVFFAGLGDRIDARQQLMRSVIVGLGIPFLLCYVLAYWRFRQRGYRVSFQKVVLLAATAICSIYTWGYDSFGEAFFIMNFFHAFQYFGLVWWSERNTMRSLFRLENARWGRPLTLALFLAIPFGYGLWAHVTDLAGIGGHVNLAYNAITVIAIMHFWYDGFIWSVRKRQV